MYSYGIDLGLNSSCIASEKVSSSVDVLELFGRNTIPSLVYYNKNSKEINVGEVARSKADIDRYCTLSDAKKYIGKDWNEIDKNEINKYKFRLVNRQGAIKYELVHNNKTIYVSPIDVTSELIKYIDSQAVHILSDGRLSKNKYNVAIGIPSTFTYKQRDATKKAAEQAGLQNIYLIPEPIAAVLAYRDSIQLNRSEKYILVYELRNNYFNVSLVKCGNNEFAIINEIQDNSIGGNCFTQKLVDYCINRIEKEDDDYNIRKSEKKMRKIEEGCKDAKMILTANDQADIFVGEDYSDISLSRSLFEELIVGYVKKTLNIVDDVISNSYLRKYDISNCILLGGSCLIPLIKESLSKIFNVLFTINPDEIVAKGCAIYAANISKYKIKYSLPRSLSFELTIKDLPKYSYGIDLGTTFSCASFVRLGSSEMISPDTSSSSKSFPSCVCYGEDFSVSIGDAAHNMRMRKNVSYIYDSKRFIGLNYDDIDEDEIKSYPFKLVKKEMIPVYNIPFKERVVSILPIDVESEIIRYVHFYATRRMFTVPDEINIKDILVAIGIPALFTDRQRESTIEAAKQAGLVNIQLIEEPVAAVLGFLENNEISNRKDCKILVYDFGGGTFDVTIINLDGDNIEILETNGDSHLGGEDITRKIEEYIINDIKQKHHINVEGNDKYKMRIHDECDRAKIQLSQCQSYTIEISISTDEDYSEDITRSKFNELCRGIFQRTMDVLDIALNKCNLKPDDIDYIVLVGGSSKIPAIDGFIKAKFKRHTKICRSINPDEAVAIGCGIYGKSLYSDELSRFKIHRRYLSYSKNGMDIVYKEMIKRFSCYPCKNSYIIHCKEGFRYIQIYESDEYNHLKKRLIDSIALNITSECDIEVKFELDENGNLVVCVKSNGKCLDDRKYII